MADEIKGATIRLVTEEERAEEERIAEQIKRFGLRPAGPINMRPGGITYCELDR